MRELGFGQVRARLHGEILRLEVEPEEIPRAAEKAGKIRQALKKPEVPLYHPGSGGILFRQHGPENHPSDSLRYRFSSRPSRP